MSSDVSSCSLIPHGKNRSDMLNWMGSFSLGNVAWSSNARKEKMESHAVNKNTQKEALLDRAVHWDLTVTTRSLSSIVMFAATCRLHFPEQMN